MVKLGICSSIENIDMVGDAGYSYIETSVGSIMKLMQDEFEEYLRKMNNSKINIEVCNCLFPGNIKLVGDELDYEQVKQYISNALDRVSQLGVDIVVFGSGGSRRIPEGYDRIKAKEQFINVMKIVGEEASKYNITIVLEPLNRSETNLMNSVKEGLELVKEVAHPNIKLLADYYHMRKESENLNILNEATAYIKHCHIAHGQTRQYPSSEDKDKYAEFIKILIQNKYEGRISIEGKTNDLKKDAKEAKKLLDHIITY